MPSRTLIILLASIACSTLLVVASPLLNARPDAALLDRYRQLLSGARGDDELKLILGALGGVAHPDALGLALPLVSRAGVRAEAQAAVEKIAESVRAEHPRAAQAAMEQLKQTKP
jgi:hypothetical protein